MALSDHPRVLAPPEGIRGALLLGLPANKLFSPGPTLPNLLGASMRRKPVNKRSSARQYNRNGGTTKAANTRPMPMRGGWRL